MSARAEQRLALHRAGFGQARGIEQRWRHVGESHARRIARAGAAPVRRPQHQGHMEARFVEKDAVRVLAVVAQRFAVIGRHGDDRLRTGGLYQASRGAIDGGDLPVVQRGREPRFQIRRRIVRIVRVVEMDPGEPGLRSRCRYPCTGARHDVVCAPLERLIPVLTRPPHAEAGVVPIEPAIESWRGAISRIEDERSNVCTGSKSGVLEDLG
jgi:hypothetical protein